MTSNSDSTPCPECGGAGYVLGEPNPDNWDAPNDPVPWKCPTCDGTGMKP